MAAGAAFVMSHFISKDSIVRFHTKYFRLKGPIIWNIFTIGMSPFSMQLAGSVVVVIMNHALKENGGDLAIGASGIISSYRHAAGYVDYRYRPRDATDCRV